MDYLISIDLFSASSASSPAAKSKKPTNKGGGSKKHVFESYMTFEEVSHGLKRGELIQVQSKCCRSLVKWNFSILITCILYPSVSHRISSADGVEVAFWYQSVMSTRPSSFKMKLFSVHILKQMFKWIVIKLIDIQYVWCLQDTGQLPVLKFLAIEPWRPCWTLSC